MKKLVCVILTLLLLLGAASCASTALPEGFDGDKLLADAENVAVLLSEKDFEAVTAIFTPAMAAALDAARLEESIGPLMDSLGPFKEVKSSAFTSGSDPSLGEYATVILVCAHENSSATYTISFDKNGELCGLYAK